MSRSGHALRSFFATLAASASSILVGFITTPLLLRWLGDERVGAYRAAIEWVGYLSLLDFGLTGSLQVALARALGRGNCDELAAAVRAGFQGGLRLTALNLLCIIGLALAVPELIRGLNPQIAQELRIGLLASLIGVLWIPLIVFRPLLEAGHLGYLVQLFLVIQQWVSCGLSLALAWGGFGLVGLFLASTLATGVASLLMARVGLLRHPEILRGPAPGITLPVVFSGPMFVFNLCGRLSLLSDLMLIGVLIGPGAVVVFSVTQRLLLVADTQILALGTAVWPALAELYHRGEHERFHARLVQLTRWVGILTGAFLVPITAATPAFVTLWVGEERYGGHLLTVVTSLFVWQHGLIALWGWPLVTLGRVQRLIPLMLTGTVVNVGLSIACTTAFGVVGPAIGSAGGYALVNGWWIVLLLRKEFGTPLAPILRAVVGPTVVAISIGTVCFYLAGEFSPASFNLPNGIQWLLLLNGMAAASLVYILICWFLVLPRADRGELWARVLGR
jgi:O-antigen/teichoic acid export membrane protein